MNGYVSNIQRFFDTGWAGSAHDGVPQGLPASLPLVS